MEATRPIRFGTSAGRTDDPDRLRTLARRAEDLGYSTFGLADHFMIPFAPIVAGQAVADATTTVRVGQVVMASDFRHPAVLAKELATLDVLSGGRVEIGIGAGWMREEFDAAGIPFDAASVRITRLEEAVTVLKGLFADEPCTFAGQHYRITRLDGLPKPVQRPHPPFFIGGGSPRVLRIAGREADLVGINASLRRGALGEHAIRDLSRDRVAEKVRWVLEGAASRGRTPEDVELEMNLWLAKVTPTTTEARDFLDRTARRSGVETELLASSPSVLVGTVEQCIDTLRERRETLRLSCFQLDAGHPNPGIDAFGPVIAALAGT